LLTVSGAADFLNPRIDPATAEGESIGTRFDDESAPGLVDQPDYMRYAGTVDVNLREPRGNPRRGGRYLFTYQQATQRVGSLSGGERSRLQLALLVLSGANFLLLDEPTNNLDIASAEVLENALNDFNGTVLVISHDRYFLDRTVNRIFALEDAQITEYIGGYSDYAGRAEVQFDRQQAKA